MVDMFQEMFEQRESEGAPVNPNVENGAGLKDDQLPIDRGSSDENDQRESEGTPVNLNVENDDANDAPRDLFGELIDSAPVQQKAQPKIEKPSNKLASTSAVTAANTTNKRGWKDQNIEVGIDFTIHYAMRTFRVEELIDEIPESGMVPLNTIREGLFKEYWDFSESRTKWDYDLELKKLIPIIVGEKNNR
jgi:hypothetical protein